MTFLPVVAREMNVLSRRRSTYLSRAISAMIALLVMFWVLIVAGAQVSSSQLGTSIFGILSTLCFIFTLLIGMQATADCLSEEKREGTLGLLFLTDLRGMDVVSGKLAASSLNTVFALLGVIPLLSLAVLLGGVSPYQLLRSTLVLINTMFFSLSIGVLVSALSRNERKAMFACFVVLFVLSLFPWIAGAMFDSFRQAERIAWISPVYSFLAVIAPSTGPYVPKYFWFSVILHHALAWCALFSASAILPRCINELPAKRFVRFRAWADDYVFGKAEQRRQHRADLLDRNAFLWLASRERVKPFYAWLILAFFGALFLWVAIQFRDMLFDPPVCLTIIVLVQFILKLWTTSEVCSRLLQDRRSGALELLLSSPLSVAEIARGQNLALRRIFRRPVIALILCEIALIFLTINNPRRNTPAIEVALTYVALGSTLLLDLWALKWVGLWLSLFGKSIEKVFFATIARVMTLPTGVFAFSAGILSVVLYTQDLSLGNVPALTLWWVTGLLCSAAFGLSARRRFLKEFRELAANRFTAMDAKPDIVKQKQRADSEHLANKTWPGTWKTAFALARTHWVMTGTAIIAVIFLSMTFGRQFYWTHKIEAELARLRAAGYPTKRAELPKFNPPIAMNDNGFAVLESAGMVNRPRSRNWLLVLMRTPGRSQKGFAALSDEDIDGFREMLAVNQAQWAALTRLTNYSKGWIDPNENVPWGARLDLLSYLSLFEAHLAVAYREGNFDRFDRDLHLLAHFLKLLNAQPSESVQILCSQGSEMFQHAFILLLNHTTANDVALAKWQERLTAIESADNVRARLALHRVQQLDAWNQPDALLAQVPVPMRLSRGVTALMGSEHAMIYEMLQDLKMAEQWADLTPEKKFKTHPPTVSSRFGAYYERMARMRGGVWSSGVDINFIEWNTLIAAERLHLLQLALGSLRYHLRHHSFPDNLEKLAPDFLPAHLRKYAAACTFESGFTNDQFTITVKKGVSILPKWTCDAPEMQLAFPLKQASQSAPGGSARGSDQP